MAKVVVDTEMIDNDLIPQAKTARQDIAITKKNAQRVNIPNNDFNWSEIISEISDCEDQTKKYINWISNENTKYKNTINTTTDKLNEIEIEELKFIEMTVK